MVKPGDLRILDAIITEGGITAAALRLGQPKATLSRHLRQLESAVGSPLFERTGTGLRLTQMGAALAEPARAVRAALETAQTRVRTLASADEGHLKIACPQLFARLVLAPYTGAFLRDRPQVSVTLQVSNAVANPQTDDLDLVITIPPPTAPYLIVQKLAQAQLGLYASPAVAAQIRTLGDLKGRQAVHTGLDAVAVAQLSLSSGKVVTRVDMPVRATANDPEIARELIAQGVGIGALPTFLADDLVRDGRLVRALPKVQAGTVDIFAVIQPERVAVPLVRAYLDGLKQELALRHFTSPKDTHRDSQVRVNP